MALDADSQRVTAATPCSATIYSQPCQLSSLHCCIVPETPRCRLPGLLYLPDPGLAAQPSMTSPECQGDEPVFDWSRGPRDCYRGLLDAAFRAVSCQQTGLVRRFQARFLEALLQPVTGRASPHRFAPLGRTALGWIFKQCARPIEGSHTLIPALQRYCG